MTKELVTKGETHAHASQVHRYHKIILAKHLYSWVWDKLLSFQVEARENWAVAQGEKEMSHSWDLYIWMSSQRKTGYLLSFPSFPDSLKWALKCHKDFLEKNARLSML